MPMQTDLTRGSIFQKLARFAAPLLLSNLLQSAYGVVDMIIAGRFIGSAGLSGITNANTVIFMFTQIALGLCNGGSILVGQYYGARDGESCKRSAATLYSLGLLLGLVFATALFVFPSDIMRLLNAPAPAEGTVYLRVCAVGFFFVCGYNAAGAALRAIGNSKAPLVCIACTTAANVVLDILFVAPMDMGVFGAALATAISQAISFFVALIFLVRSRDILGIYPLRFRLHPDKLGKELQLGFPLAVQQSMATISWLSITFLLNAHGIAVSAGSGVSNKIKDFVQLFNIAIGTAVSGMVAQNIGAKEYDRARKTVFTGVTITLFLTAVLVGITELLAPQLVALFTTETETSAMAMLNYRIEILGQFFYAVMLVYHALMIGAGRPWYAFASSFINCILIRVPLAIVLDRFFGVSGLFWACMIAPASSIPFCLWFERSGRWRIE